jgi:hypothetical protein
MLITIFLLIVLAVIGLAAIPLMVGIARPIYGWPARRSSKPDLWRQVNMFFGCAVVVAVAIAALAIMAWHLAEVGLGAALHGDHRLVGAAGATFWYARRRRMTLKQERLR